MNAGSIAGWVSTILGLLGTSLAAGWPGIIAMFVSMGVSLFLLRWAINKWNDSVDQSDEQRAGADAGQTSVGLANQADQGRQGLDQLEKLDPPTSGAPKP